MRVRRFAARPPAFAAPRVEVCPLAAAPMTREVDVIIGWPIAVRGGDCDASSLNLAVFSAMPPDTFSARTRANGRNGTVSTTTCGSAGLLQRAFRG